MRLRAVLALIGFALMFSAQAADYSGFWKVNCEDDIGLQIKPLAGGVYAIALCRPEGCSKPGRYRPNTKIDNDPMYQVQSSTRIRVRDSEGGLRTYVRCTDLNYVPR